MLAMTFGLSIIEPSDYRASISTHLIEMHRHFGHIFRAYRCWFFNLFTMLICCLVLYIYGRLSWLLIERSFYTTIIILAPKAL